MEQKSQMKIWILYTFIVAFSVYWVSNLVLWFPWSISPTLGISLMLTVGTAVWAVAAYQCLIPYPGRRQIEGALVTGVILLIVAVIKDYVFFGLIRNAMTELYHPTTFFGYGFLVGLPVILVFALRKRIERNTKTLGKMDFVKVVSLGLVCFGLLTLIIVFKIEI